MVTLKGKRQNEGKTLKHLEMGCCKNDTESIFGDLLCYNTKFATTNFESVLRKTKKESIQHGEKEQLNKVKRTGGTNKSQQPNELEYI